MPSRLVRRRPLAERIKAYFNPLDLFLSLSEALDSSDWEQWRKEWATPIGISLNAIFIVARANSGLKTRKTGDDVFGDDVEFTGWLAWFAAFLVHMLSVLSFLNAAYTFNHQRHYRLFETSLDAPPSTPSAHRVKVDSSPIASSPMRFLSDMIVGENADARSHPDATRDIWEMAVWDPTPICLRMFCLFSPGHVLVYWLFLPVLVSDPRPSTTVFTTMVVASLISIQLLLLQSSFSQQSRDASVIHKEVLHEYDTKFVHPRTQPLMRDVGTQFSHTQPSTGDSKQYQGVDNESISTYTPTYIINRGFHTRPNPNYVEHVDSSSSKWRPIPSREISSNIMPPIQVPTNQRDMSTPIRPQTAIRQPQFRTAGTGDGGSLGVFSHANSPLRKTKSTNLMGQITANERGHSPVKRGGSPRKRSSLAPMSNGQTLSHM